MQYFITHAYNAHADEISIHDPRIVYQCHTVLRMKIGTQICIQDTPHRYTVAITSINKKCIEGEIIQDIQKEKSDTVNVLTALIALPNRAEKSEIIVQKLGEIGIDHIVWYTGHYSQLRDCSEKKITRMQTIALEASEQSHNRTVPTIAFVPDLKKYITKNNNQAYILYDCPSDQQIPNETVASPLLIKRGLGEICGETQKTFIIGAEGGFGKGDYEIFDMIKNLTHGNLGDSILRMETAAIVAGWLLRN